MGWKRKRKEGNERKEREEKVKKEKGMGREGVC